MVTDLFRSKTELVAENTLLRQQLIVLSRQVKKPKYTPLDRTILVILSRLSRSWRDAVLIVKPHTILRWHRSGYKFRHPDFREAEMDPFQRISHEMDDGAAMSEL